MPVNPFSVLIIEDEDHPAELVQSFLGELRGYRFNFIEQVRFFEDGVNKVRKEWKKLDLLFLDLHLLSRQPGISGESGGLQVLDCILEKCTDENDLPGFMIFINSAFIEEIPEEIWAKYEPLGIEFIPKGGLGGNGKDYYKVTFLHKFQEWLSKQDELFHEMSRLVRTGWKRYPVVVQYHNFIIGEGKEERFTYLLAADDILYVFGEGDNSYLYLTPSAREKFKEFLKKERFRENCRKQGDTCYTELTKLDELKRKNDNSREFRELLRTLDRMQKEEAVPAEYIRLTTRRLPEVDQDFLNYGLNEFILFGQSYLVNVNYWIGFENSTEIVRVAGSDKKIYSAYRWARINQAWKWAIKLLR